ncbi:hypothetical protein LC55x_4376 [Lysobacter capsici]|nr:hypothetical protein LC55x_4376 [Lysobacter capsici]
MDIAVLQSAANKRYAMHRMAAGQALVFSRGYRPGIAPQRTPTSTSPSQR